MSTLDKTYKHRSLERVAIKQPRGMWLVDKVTKTSPTSENHRTVLWCDTVEELLALGFVEEPEASIEKDWIDDVCKEIDNDDGIDLYGTGLTNDKLRLFIERHMPTAQAKPDTHDIKVFKGKHGDMVGQIIGNPYKDLSGPYTAPQSKPYYTGTEEQIKQFRETIRNEVIDECIEKFKSKTSYNEEPGEPFDREEVLTALEQLKSKVK